MSDIIALLPDSVANQIAAGEVVDRPAGAVKELLENAIDAGATQVDLVVKDAGRTLIQVIDNGCGMSDTDARLCFERHATSKIKEANDLFAIHTMGFRGEALASIAAIAQVELKTKQLNAELGTRVVIEGSQVIDQEPATCPSGTSLAVKNLFFNIPARRNFLKKDSIELSHIEEIFKRVALVHHSVGFSFHSNGRLLYDLKPGNMAQRIANIYGDNYKEKLYPIDSETEVVKIHGYVSKAEYVRKSRGEQYLFVNGRFIKHLALGAAVEKAYTDLIPAQSYPSYFIMLSVDPSRIDVNIHPTKTEVKFVDEHAIFALLRSTTKQALGQFSLATEIDFDPTFVEATPPAPKGYTPPEPTIDRDPMFNPFGGGSTPRIASNWGGRGKAESNPMDWQRFFDTPDTQATAPTADRIEIPSRSAQAELPGLETPDADSHSSASAALFQLQNRFIVSTLRSGLLIIDQNRAHERVLYECLMAHADPNCAQQLLFPVSCTFSPSDMEILAELQPDLRQMGFEMEQLGSNTFVVTATPPRVADSRLQEVFNQVLADYKGQTLQRFCNRDQCLARAMARQMAVKSGKALSLEEMQRLMADLFSCQAPDVSPDGKKTMVILSETHLANMF